LGEPQPTAFPQILLLDLRPEVEGRTEGDRCRGKDKGKWERDDTPTSNVWIHHCETLLSTI